MASLNDYKYFLPSDTTPDELDVIIDLAAGASRTYSTLLPVERAAMLEMIADNLDSAREILVPLAATETHLPIGRLHRELERTTFQLRFFAQVVTDGGYLGVLIDTPAPEWPPGPRPDLRRVLRPLGPVIVFSASNFPFAFSIAGGDTASALAAGCPVVVKAHPGHPRLSKATSEIVLQALEQFGAPKGVFSIIYGEDAGRNAVVDARITAAAFTGSLRGGRTLFELATLRPVPIPFYGELGSINPVFVTKSALARRRGEVLEGFVGSFTQGSGQFCTKPGVLLVPAEAKVEDDLFAALVNIEPTLMLNDHIRTNYLNGLNKLMAHPEVRAPVCGTWDVSNGVAPSLLATSVKNLVASHNELLVECFGPVALVATYDEEQELVGAAEAFEGQLTASLQAEEDDQIATELVECLSVRAGRVLWNEWPTGVAVSWAMHHGGPYPATTSPLHTSVGATAISRFLRPITYQSMPDTLLPPALRNDNPLALPRKINGRMEFTTEIGYS